MKRKENFYWNKEKIVNVLKIYKKKYGLLYRKDINKVRKKFEFCSLDTIKDRFGGFDNLEKYANEIFFIKKKKAKTKDEIINLSKNIFNEFSIDLTRCDFYEIMKNRYNITKKLIFIRFGRADNLAELCNYKFKKQIIYPNQKKFSKKEILEDLTKVFKKYKNLKKSDLKKFYGKEIRCYVDVIRNKFGSLDNVAKLCGYKFKTEQDLIKVKKINEVKNIISKYKKINKKILYENTNVFVLRKYFGSLDNLSKMLNFKIYPTFRKFKKFPECMLGKNETKILNFIEKQKNIKLIRQKSVYTYFVDGYDKENNVVYEVDEIHHKFRKEYDIKRENKIKEVLGCEIIRINEQQFLKKLGVV